MKGTSPIKFQQTYFWFIIMLFFKRPQPVISAQLFA